MPACLKSTRLWTLEWQEASATDEELARCGPLVYIFSEKPSGSILDGLNYADEAVREAVEQWITAAQYSYFL